MNFFLSGERQKYEAKIAKLKGDVEQHQKLTSTKNETIKQIITILENNLTNKNQRKAARDLSEYLDKTNLEEEA